MAQIAKELVTIDERFEFDESELFNEGEGETISGGDEEPDEGSSDDDCDFVLESLGAAPEQQRGSAEAAGAAVCFA